MVLSLGNKCFCPSVTDSFIIRVNPETEGTNVLLLHEFVQKIIDDEQTKSSLKSRSVLLAIIVNFVQSCKLTNNFISPSRPPSVYANVGRVFHALRFARSKIALVTYAGKQVLNLRKPNLITFGFLFIQHTSY
jgi:hypothetical protein